VQAIAKGFLEYQTGRRNYKESDYRTAAMTLSKAERRLASAQSPFALRARLALACAYHYVPDYQQALRLEDSLEMVAVPARYRSLYAESLWMRGLTNLANGAPTESKKAYLLAVAEFQRLGDVESIAGVENLVAELLDEQGDSIEAWKHRYKVLQVAREVQDPQRLYQLLSLMAWASNAQGEPELALYFQDKAVAYAEELRSPVASGNAHFWRSIFLHRTGQDERASQDLVEARAAAVRLPEGGEKERLLSGIGLSEAQMWAGRKPESSIPLLTQAIEHSKGVRKKFDNKISLYLMRAQALRASGNIDAAKSDLLTCIDLIENLRLGITEESERQSFFDKSRDAYDEMMLLQLEDRNNPGLALEYAEYERARVLKDRFLGPSSGEGRSVRVSEDINGVRVARLMQAKFPVAKVMITYAIAGAKIVTLVSDRSGIRRVLVSGEGQIVSRDLQTLRDAVSYQSDDLFAFAVADLYNHLIRPRRADLPAGAGLVFNCSGVLQSIPYSALLDQATGRYLVEDFEVSVVPTAEVFFYRRDSEVVGLPNKLRALIVSGPLFSRQAFTELSSLPEAEKEGTRVARLFPNYQMLQGRDASRSRFLKEAPNYDVILFSGHAHASEVDPAMSSLVFSPESGGSGDGGLSAEMIYQMHLKRTELVILAACGTGEGRPSVSGGVESIMQAFLAAGVSTVIGSLWSVEDDAAGEFLGEFTGRFVAGGSPSSAVRLAQLSLLYSSKQSLRRARVWSVFQMVGSGF
jgi:CHAT domain-containing protein